MELFEAILKDILLTESVSIDDVNDAIDNHKKVIISYHTNGEDNNTGARVVEVYAYGLTKAGNPVIRCFQPYGDTTSRVPSWKFFRLDRISEWKPTKQTFSRPADYYFKNLGDFNPNGDETMSVVYKIAKFDDDANLKINPSQPKTKQEVYKTDTERGMERFRQQLQNPITISDLKLSQPFKDVKNNANNSGPKTKQDVYKTDTERNMERFRQQMENPVTLSDIQKPNTTNNNKERLEKLRQVLRDKPATLSDLSKKMSEPTNNNNDVYKTDTERNMERFRQQMENPETIDLDKIPKR